MYWKFFMFSMILFLLYQSAEQRKRRRRQADGWGLAAPTGVPCTFNPCNITNFCGNGRECVMDPVGSCFHACKCLDNITHPDCRPLEVANVTTTESPTKATTDDAEDDSCPPGFPCQNGDCVTTGTVVQCECWDGWEGYFCETESPKCSLPCPGGHECKLIPGTTGMQICVRVDTSTEQPPAPSPALCPADQLPLRPSHERVCTGGLTCHGGWCNKTRQDDGSVSVECVCDPGFVGLLCEDTCCLDCGEHGVCQLNPDGEEYCDCSAYYTGERCDQKTCNASYQFRPIKERSCTGGLPCYGGWCNETRDDEGVLLLSVRCVCDPGFTGPICNEPCCLDCGKYGVCNLNNDGEEDCNCFHNRTGDRCEKIRQKYGPPEKVTWYLWVVGVCAVVLFLLLLLLVIIPYVMWRHRVILVMKIVHYFQAYEDNDEREWDAFVSYKADDVDEHFVVHTLYPKLEKELGFKLNLHFRDFIPGETIANNIIRAVQGSRRTILVITPRYVKSEFTRFEYQLAQQEMLKRKHRIIPLILEDVSDLKSTLDPNLKVIMSSVTYLEWPSEETERKLCKFWKRLELSLPKKRPKDTEVEVGNEVADSSDPAHVDVAIIETPPPRYEDINFTNVTTNERKQTNEQDKVLNSISGDKKRQITNGFPPTTQNSINHSDQSSSEQGNMVELQNIKNLEQARERYLEILETAEQGEFC